MPQKHFSPVNCQVRKKKKKKRGRKKDESTFPPVPAGRGKKKISFKNHVEPARCR